MVNIGVYKLWNLAREISGDFSCTISANAHATSQHATKVVAQLAENNKSNVLKVVIISMGKGKMPTIFEWTSICGGRELHEGAVAHELGRSTKRASESERDEKNSPTG